MLKYLRVNGMIEIWTLEGHGQDTNSVNVLISRHSRIKWQGGDLTVTVLILLTSQVDSEDMTLSNQDTG